jgi:iron complex outermembrane receptor protein
VRFVKPITLLLLSLAICHGVKFPSYAQSSETGHEISPAERRPFEIEEITITSRRREENLQEVPLSVSSFDETALTDASVTSMVNLGELTPNLYVQGTGAGGGGIVSIRSQTAPEVLLTLDPAVGVYLDGVYLPRQRGNLGKLFDVERVEVLRGPQGTLFGRNTTGGAIQVISNKPSGGFGGFVDLIVGSYDRVDVQAALEAPVTDTLSARAAVYFTNRDGYTDNIFLDRDLDDDESQNWRLSLLWTPTDKIESLLVHDGMVFSPHGGSTRVAAVAPGNPDSPVYGTGLCVAGVLGLFDTGGVSDCMTGGGLSEELRDQKRRGLHKVTSDVRQKTNIEQFGVANTTTVNFDALSVRNIVAWRHLHQFNDIDVDGTKFQLLDAALDLKQWQVSEELHVLGTSFSDRLDWIGGFYFFYEDGDDGSDNTSFSSAFEDPALGAIFPDPNPNTFDGHATQWHVSGFGQITYALPWVDDLRLTAGLRYNFDRREFTAKHHDANGCTIIDPNDPTMTLPDDRCKRKESKDFDEPTWTVGLDWRARDDLMFYAATRGGYRSGGFNLRSVAPSQYEPFDSEQVIDVEAGLKADWEFWGGSMRTNVAGFWADYDDIQRTFLTLSGTTFLTNVENAAGATIYGSEIEVIYLPWSDLWLRTGVGISIARYDDFEVPDFSDPDVTVDRSDERFTAAPDYTVNATLRYSLPFDSIGGVDIGDVGFQFDFSWVSKIWLSFNQGPGSIEQDPYPLFNLRLDSRGIAGTNFDVAFFIRNLADEEYLTGAVNLFDTGGFSFAGAGAPRTFNGQVTYRFN